MIAPISAPYPIDVFCKVVDHHGDAGTAWRLCREIRQLAGNGAPIRLFIDDPVTLMPLAGETWSEKSVKRMPNGVEVIPWSALPLWLGQGGRGGPVAIEMFGCDIPDRYRTGCKETLRLIINLEYFSCEAWAEGCHLLESKLDGGQVRKYFFMPGLTLNSGGIMSCSRPVIPTSEREIFREKWLGEQSLPSAWAQRSWMSVYTYQTDFGPLLKTLQMDSRPWLVWVFGQANHEQVRQSIGDWSRETVDPRLEGYEQGRCTVMLMPFLSQPRFDALLAAGDWALVRGEDSFAGGLLSGRPFLWQLYPQQEEIHRIKMEAFLKILEKEGRASTHMRTYAEATRAFNFPDQGSGVQWNRLSFGSHENGLPWESLAAFLRVSCNLTEKLLEFISRFFQGDIT